MLVNALSGMQLKLALFSTLTNEAILQDLSGLKSVILWLCGLREMVAQGLLASKL